MQDCSPAATAAYAQLKKKTLPSTELSEGTATVQEYWFSFSILVLPKPRGSEEGRCTVGQVEQVIHERVDSKVQRVP